MIIFIFFDAYLFLACNGVAKLFINFNSFMERWFRSNRIFLENSLKYGVEYHGWIIWWLNQTTPAIVLENWKGSRWLGKKLTNLFWGEGCEWWSETDTWADFRNQKKWWSKVPVLVLFEKQKQFASFSPAGAYGYAQFSPLLLSFSPSSITARLAPGHNFLHQVIRRSMKGRSECVSTAPFCWRSSSARFKI